MANELQPSGHMEDGMFAVKKKQIRAKEWRISRLFMRLASVKPCGKLGFLVWKHICFLV